MENINLVDEQVKALDDVSAWLADAKSSEFGFVKAAYRAFEQFEKGNRNPLAKLLTVVNGKKAKRVRNVEGNKLIFANPLKRLVQHILPNVTAKFDQHSEFGVAWGVKANANNVFDTDSLAKLATIAQVNIPAPDQTPYSCFSKDFKEAFPPIQKDAKEKTQAELLAAKKASLLKWLEENNLELSVLIHTLQAKETNEPNH